MNRDEGINFKGEFSRIYLYCTQIETLIERVQDILFRRKYSIVGYTYTDCPILFYKWIHRGQYRHFSSSSRCSKFHSSCWQDIFSGLPGCDVKYYFPYLETLLIANYFDIN